MLRLGSDCSSFKTLTYFKMCTQGETSQRVSTLFSDIHTHTQEDVKATAHHTTQDIIRILPEVEPHRFMSSCVILCDLTGSMNVNKTKIEVVRQPAVKRKHEQRGLNKSG